MTDVHFRMESLTEMTAIMLQKCKGHQGQPDEKKTQLSLKRTSKNLFTVEAASDRNTLPHDITPAISII